MSHGVYLKCERCPVTIGGEQVTKNPEPSLSGWWQGGELRKRAAAYGWTTFDVAPSRPWEDRTGDLCPQCSQAAS